MNKWDDERPVKHDESIVDAPMKSGDDNDKWQADLDEVSH